MNELYAFHYCLADEMGFHDSTDTIKITTYFASECDALHYAAKHILSKIEYVIASEDDLNVATKIIGMISNCNFEEAIELYNDSQDKVFLYCEKVGVIRNHPTITLTEIHNARTVAEKTAMDLKGEL